MSDLFFSLNKQVVDSESIDVPTDGVKTLDSDKVTPSGPRPSGAIISVEAEAVAVTFDGTTPTGDIGHKVTVGSAIQVNNYDNLLGFKAIGRGSTATLYVSYFR